MMWDGREKHSSKKINIHTNLTWLDEIRTISVGVAYDHPTTVGKVSKLDGVTTLKTNPQSASFNNRQDPLIATHIFAVTSEPNMQFNMQLDYLCMKMYFRKISTKHSAKTMFVEQPWQCRVC